MYQHTKVADGVGVRSSDLKIVNGDGVFAYGNRFMSTVLSKLCSELDQVV